MQKIVMRHNIGPYMVVSRGAKTKLQVHFIQKKIDLDGHALKYSVHLNS